MSSAGQGSISYLCNLYNYIWPFHSAICHSAASPDVSGKLRHTDPPVPVGVHQGEQLGRLLLCGCNAHAGHHLDRNRGALEAMVVCPMF